jgi:hypothetical protein
MGRRPIALSGVLIVAILAVLYAASPAASAVAVADVPDDLAAALAAQGWVTEHVPVLQRPAFARDVTPQMAVDSARKQFGMAGDAEAYVALATLSNGPHLGDETTPLEISGRPAYVVQITGLSLPPLGGHAQTMEQMMHHELIVLVDAHSGAWLVATDFR